MDGNLRKFFGYPANLILNTWNVNNLAFTSWVNKKMDFPKVIEYYELEKKFSTKKRTLQSCHEMSCL